MKNLAWTIGFPPCAFLTALIALQPKTTGQYLVVVLAGIVALLIMAVLFPWAQHRFGPEARFVDEAVALRDAGFDCKDIVDLIRLTSPTPTQTTSAACAGDHDDEPSRRTSTHAADRVGPETGRLWRRTPQLRRTT